MLGFKQFISSFKGFILGIIKKIKSTISSIGFGRSVSISMTPKKPRTIKESAAGGQSKFGYLSEFSTVRSLIGILFKNGLNVEFNGKTGQAAYTAAEKKEGDYIREILSADSDKKTKSSISTQVDAGKAMAKSIWKDAIYEADDLAFLNFEVIHTGDSLKGISKADVRMIISKDNKKVIVDDILASLKSYKSWSINLANTTIISFMDNLGVSKYIDSDIKSEIKIYQNIRAMIFKVYKEDLSFNDSKNKVIAMYSSDVWKVVDHLFKSRTGIVESRIDEKVEATKEMKDALQQSYLVISKTMLPKFVNAVNDAYKTHRKEVNINMLELLGFDGSDEFYLAVSTSKGMKVISSRTSKEYKKLLDELHKSFIVEFNYNTKNTSSISVLFKTANGDVLVKGTISVGKTGSVGSSKLNAFIDFGFLNSVK